MNGILFAAFHDELEKIGGQSRSLTKRLLRNHPSRGFKTEEGTLGDLADHIRRNKRASKAYGPNTPKLRSLFEDGQYDRAAFGDTGVLDHASELADVVHPKSSLPGARAEVLEDMQTVGTTGSSSHVIDRMMDRRKRRSRLRGATDPSDLGRMLGVRFL